MMTTYVSMHPQKTENFSVEWDESDSGSHNWLIIKVEGGQVVIHFTPPIKKEQLVEKFKDAILG